MIFTEKDTSIMRQGIFSPPAAEILIERDAVKVIGTTRISLIHFQTPQKMPVDMSVTWDKCEAQTEACVFNTSVVHKSQESNLLFMCGTNGEENACCYMTISEDSAKCSPSDKVQSLQERITGYDLKDAEASAFVEGADSADLYIADSGSHGIRRFGKHFVLPAQQGGERRYVKLIVSKQNSIDDVIQDKVYGFYNEKNMIRDDMYGNTWKPYVTQICTTDKGGPKRILQFTWTSQLNARLFCGDVDQKQHFSELLDVVTVESEHWPDTRVYGLFQNEWGMRAVCVYTLQNIDHIFKTSPFKDSNNQPNRPRTCVADSTKLSSETLKQIAANCEMEKCIEPVSSPRPLVISGHRYTHITAHDFRDHRDHNHTVLFLSLQNGAVHKVAHRQSGSEAKMFLIAEFKPFNHRAHIVRMSLNPSTRQLVVASWTEVAQVDLVNCGRYGNTCEECVLARDPYCGWSDGHCTESGHLQDIEGDISICPKSTHIKVHRLAAHEKVEDPVVAISVPRGSRYFLECPVSSHHAQYTWHHGNRAASCIGTQHQCLLLIYSMQSEQEGEYTCESEERGHRRELVQYRLRVEDSAEGFSTGSLPWLGLIAALLVHS